MRRRGYKVVALPSVYKSCFMYEYFYAATPHDLKMSMHAGLLLIVTCSILLCIASFGNSAYSCRLLASTSVAAMGDMWGLS